jgi:hypothetical protein
VLKVFAHDVGLSRFDGVCLRRLPLASGTRHLGDTGGLVSGQFLGQEFVGRVDDQLEPDREVVGQLVLAPGILVIAPQVVRVIQVFLASVKVDLLTDFDQHELGRMGERDESQAGLDRDVGIGAELILHD